MIYLKENKTVAVKKSTFEDMKFPYLILNPSCSLKYMENYYAYNKDKDGLYKINEETLRFLMSHQNLQKSEIKSQSMKEFLQYLFSEGIIINSKNKVSERSFKVDEKFRPTLPSLRYLLIHLTLKCNLHCKHCYTDASSENQNHLSFETAKKIFEQMQDLQGLIVLFSGGEPLCHPDFWKINEMLPNYDLRFEMLSNGTLITKDVTKRLNVQHVQISIDGMEEAHDFMRGKGAFKKAISGIENLINAGKEVSISTMIHSKNLNDFEKMEDMWKKYGITQWIINQPSAAGRWNKNSKYGVPIEAAAEIVRRFSQGEGPHKSKTNYTCGSHICTVLTDGRIFPCPFLNDDDMLMGSIGMNGLREAWKNKKGVKVSELTECLSCEHLEKCRGGCRFRAREHGHLCGKDPVLCAIHNKPLNK